MGGMLQAFAGQSVEHYGLEVAAAHEWTVVSLKNDWDAVFANA
jgi:hypothetical protein